MADQPVRGTGELLRPGSLGGLKIVKAGDYHGPERALIYGANSVGKTPLLASANKVECFAPTLIINIDSGAKSLANLYPDTDVISPRNFEEFDKLFQSLYELFDRKRCPYKSICVDGTTTAQLKGIDYLYRKENANMSFAEFTTAELANGGWVKSTRQMEKMFGLFRDLPVHLFMTAWAEDIAPAPEKIGQKVTPYYVPDFTKKLRSIACGSFDSILYMYLAVHPNTGVATRTLRTRAHKSAMARDRGDRLPETIDNPTMELLAKHWGLL
jgi:hypothetical protein